MESKRVRNTPDVVRGFSLLIEPVWNRNLRMRNFLHTRRKLLIEPVWNRNFDICALDHFSHILLIEPVWNRNFEGNRHYDQVV